MSSHGSDEEVGDVAEVAAEHPSGAPVNNTEPETGATGAIGLTDAMIAKLQEMKFQAELEAIEEAAAFRRKERMLQERKLEAEAEAQERFIEHQLQLKLEFETLAAEKRKLTLDASMDASPPTPAKEMDTEARRLSVVPEGGTFEESCAAGSVIGVSASVGWGRPSSSVSASASVREQRRSSSMVQDMLLSWKPQPGEMPEDHVACC